jgi:hypothetical protein
MPPGLISALTVIIADDIRPERRATTARRRGLRKLGGCSRHTMGQRHVEAAIGGRCAQDAARVSSATRPKHRACPRSSRDKKDRSNGRPSPACADSQPRDRLSPSTTAQGR